MDFWERSIPSRRQREEQMQRPCGLCISGVESSSKVWVAEQSEWGDREGLARRVGGAQGRRALSS